MDHLSTETTVGWSMDHLSDTNTTLYKDHLSTETTITWSSSGLNKQFSLDTPHTCVCKYTTHKEQATYHIAGNFRENKISRFLQLSCHCENIFAKFGKKSLLKYSFVRSMSHPDHSGPSLARCYQLLLKRRTESYWISCL